MKIKNYLIVASLLLMVNNLHAQMTLTIEKALAISLEHSPDLLKAELNMKRSQSLLSAQEASLKSQFKLNVNPFKYSNSRYLDARLSEWYTNESLSSSGTFSISQPIVWTGSTISLNNKFGWQSNNSSLSGTNNNSEVFTNSLYLNFDQPLFTYNSLKVELVSLEMDYENATISYALTRLSLERSIISQFYSVYMAQENLAISKDEIENARQNYEIIKEKVRLDMIPKAELFQAELNLSNSESSLENQTVSLEGLKDKFKQMLGLPLNQDITTEAKILELAVPIDSQMAVEHALTNRLELKQRAITNKNAEFSLQRIEDNGSLNGSLSLSVGIMGDDAHIQNIYDSPTQSPSVGLSLSIPIFDWGARKDRINAQKLQMQVNEINEEQELIDIEMDVVSSCRSLTNLVKQIEIAKKSVENAQQTYDLNVEKYRAGEITGMEMDEFQAQLSSMKISLAQKMVNYKLELLNLKIISLYDFENREPISPLLMYSTDAMKEYKKYKDKSSK